MSNGTEPAKLEPVVRHLFRAPFRWWVVGGCALAMHAGRDWRPHKDVDLAIVQGTADVFLNVIRQGGFEVLRPFSDDFGSLSMRHDASPSTLYDVHLSAGDDSTWIYRRDPNIRLIWSEAVVRNSRGLPHAAAEVELLSKARRRNTDDLNDACEVLPTMSVRQIERLNEWLGVDHPWSSLARDALLDAIARTAIEQDRPESGGNQ